MDTAQSDIVYYYAVTSVDDHGDESVQSAVVSPNINSGGSGGGWCFICTAKSSSRSGGVYVALVLGMMGMIMMWFRAFGIRNSACDELPSTCSGLELVEGSRVEFGMRKSKKVFRMVG